VSNRRIAQISILLGITSMALGGYVQFFTPAGVFGGFVPVATGAVAICGGLLLWNK